MFHVEHVSSLFLLLLVSFSVADLRHCLFHSSDTYPFFGTKTAYVNNRFRGVNATVDTSEQCEARSIWFLSRHGTRNPGVKYLRRMREHLPLLRDQILQNHAEGLGELCHFDLELLSRWRLVANDSESKYLVEEGYSELEKIGQRMKKRFPTLFTHYSNDSYVFAYTESQRTEASAIAFAKGAFEDDHHKVWYRPPVTPDPLLRFYKTCQKWRRHVHKNFEAFVEVKKYESGPEMDKVRRNISARLGFNRTLTQSEVDLVYLMCAFDEAWRPQVDSPWCSVFTPDDLEIIEYREDLKYYYDSGYGYEVNYHQGCPMVRDIITVFLKGVSDESSKGVFYFTHSGTILKFLARLGLFKDELPLLHNNYGEHKNRQWRTSLIDSFASNIALALHKCGNEFKVTAYVQERLVQLPFCRNLECSLSEFVDGYGEIGHSCDFDGICTLPLGVTETSDGAQDLPDIEDA